MDVDYYDAACADDLKGTVNYADVCDLICTIAKKECYNLIEKLAYETAFALIEKFTHIKKIKLTVSKPQAPVKHLFKNISVCCELEKNRVILSLGSSIGDGEKTLTNALDELNACRGVKVKKVSSMIKTAPYGGVAKNEFTNCAAELECLLPPKNLLEIIHNVEKNSGRERKERWGDRTLDIDIIFFGNKIITEEGLSVPHPDYQNRHFVINPIKEIAPDFVCPDTRKRISDL
jgi:dihydroneopterin aldolase/2-amino-4-hydroxy-6-hydroxymethyldihydropteridine diphosphokinase